MFFLHVPPSRLYVDFKSVYKTFIKTPAGGGGGGILEGASLSSVEL